jgi:isopentenyldiphosphate isomerase
LPAYGVHCNVWSKVGNSTIIHLAKRSKTIDKFPGFYDNLVAGGQPTKISIKDNLFKEAYEEAGLNRKYMRFATKSRTVHYNHNEINKFNSSVIFIYHLEKSDGMKFKNLDGEVESFMSLDIKDLHKILEANKLKPNCIIPIIEFFISKDNDFISKNAILELRKLLKFYD